MKLQSQLKKEIYRITSYKTNDVPSWVIANINDLVKEASDLIENAVDNGKVKIVDEDVIHAAAHRAISNCY